MAAGIYEWKQPAPKLPGVNGGTAPKNPVDPMAPAQGQSTTSPFGTTQGNKDAFGGASFGDMLKSPTGGSPTPSFNDLFQGVGEQRGQNVQAATQNIAQGFQPQGPSLAGEQARNSFLKSQDETQRQVLEQSALAGRGDTGQIVGDNRNFLTQQAQPARMDFEAQLQSQEEGQARQRSQDAMGNLLALEGLGEQSRSTEAQNALTARGQDITVRGQDIQSQQADKALAENARQFNTRQEFETWATREGWNQDAIDRAWQSTESSKEIASREKLGFADLSVREKELSQQGQQFKDELAFKKFATEGGWSQQEADRAWKSLESEKDRSLTSTESALDRELNKFLTEKKLDIDERQLGETIRQFDGKLAFDQWATQAGLDDNEKSRVWDGHLQDLNQKWQTGERLGSQEHQVLIEDKRVQADQLAQQFEKATQLEVLGKTQEWDKAKTELLNTYQTLRSEQEMGHDEAMTLLKGDMETRLTQMGIDATAARQAAEIEAQRWEVNQQLDQQSTLANAELLYKYDSLRQQAGISEQELDLKRTEVQNQVTQFAQTFGLDQKRVDALLKSEEAKADWDQQSILMELAGDDPDMVKFASHQFVNTLGRRLGISPEELAQMHADIDYVPPKPTTPTQPILSSVTGGRTTTRTGR